MKNKTVMLVGPRSTPDLISGMSISFESLISGFEERSLPYVVVDRSVGMAGKKVGAFSVGGVLSTISLLYTFLLNLPEVGSVYMAIGTSRLGFFRDALMIWTCWFLRKRNIIHLKGGGFLDFYERSPSWMQKMMQLTLAKVEVIIVLGQLLRDQFRFVPSIDDKLKVVPNGLPRDVHLNGERNSKIISPDLFRVLYLSNMIPSKGYLELFEACKILRHERQIPITCDFCGAFLQTVNDDEYSSSSDAENEFRNLVDESGLQDCISYHGTVKGKTKNQFLDQAHVFVLPTEFPWEGQPISIIEAMAYGLPVIASRYRGIPEQVIDGHNGFLINPRSPSEIADAIETLWRDPGLYQKCSINSFNRYQEEFTLEKHLNRLIPILLGDNTVS